jgi:membrane-bound serine protease (ClpP class)
LNESQGGIGVPATEGTQARPDRDRRDYALSRSLRFVPALVVALLAGQPVLSGGPPPERRPVVFEFRIDDEAITPVTVRLVRRAIELAEQQRAACLVIILDTPGGLVDSTRHVVKSILRSDVPIVVYVSPAGARAASAGVFITLAAHVAAMAPGTNIGAAHPVEIGGLPGPSRQPAKKDGAAPDATPREEKVLNDTVAWARSLAELRGRNAEWATRAVKESLSASASEAVRERAVDFMADDIDELLAQADGREVTLPSGPVRLRTAGAEIRTIERWWGDQLLGALANPNVAFLLLLFGFYGILFELYTPGWGVAGVVGIICLVLGFFALAVLPINYVGLALIALALAMFVAEAFVVSYGFLTIGGAACLVLGGLMLVESAAGFQRISLWLIIPVALATAAITFFLLGSIVKSQRSKTQTGDEELFGAAAVAVETFVPAADHYLGTVRAHGELWRAVSPASIEAGQQVRIADRDGLTLTVVPSDAHHDTAVDGTSHPAAQQHTE